MRPAAKSRLLKFNLKKVMGVGADVVLGVDVAARRGRQHWSTPRVPSSERCEQIPVDASGDAESILSAICDGLLRVAAGTPDGLPAWRSWHR